MAILLRTLLKAQGFDARLTDIGTVDIPYRMSEIATLASVNHMICSLIYQGKTYYLDATNEYINAEFIPESIQGREAVIENGENCIVHTLPMLNSSASTDSLSYICSLSDKQTNKVLQGNVTRSWSGDMKEFFLTAYHENDKSGRKEYLPRILTGDNHNYQINSVSWIQQEPQQEWAALTGEVINSSAVQIADNEFYIELDLHNDLFDQPIDTAKRIHDYELPLRCRIVRHTELEIPAGYVLSYCPKGISIHTPQGILCCSYKTERNKIIFRKIMEITEKRIPATKLQSGIHTCGNGLMHPTNKSSSKNNNNETEHVIPDGVLALLLTTPNANADDKEKYKLFAEETRKEVWALKLPEFTNTAVPDKYKDESAVILAAHSRLEITKRPASTSAPSSEDFIISTVK